MSGPTLSGAYWAQVAAAAPPSGVVHPPARDDPRPVEVLVGDIWVPGWLTSWERRGSDWYANVTYTRLLPATEFDTLYLRPPADGPPMLLTWDQIRPAREVRPRDSGR